MTGCTVVGVVQHGVCDTPPDRDMPLPADGELLLIGDADAEARFFGQYLAEPEPSRLRRILRR